MNSHNEPLVVPFRFETEQQLWTIDDILQPAECRELCRLIDESPESLTSGDPLYRDQDRMSIDDENLARKLFTRMAPHLPKSMGPLHLERLNSRIRLYRYRPGQQFAPHMDHWYQPCPSELTLHTLLVYLNDDFEGGATRFTEQLEADISPRQGRAAVWQHKLRHMGCEVTSGRKYALRTDVVYRSGGAPIAVNGGVPGRPARY